MDPISLVTAIVALIVAITAIIITFSIRGQPGSPGATGPQGPPGPTGSGTVSEIVSLITPSTYTINVIGISGITYYLDTENDSSTLVIGLQPNVIAGQTFRFVNLGPDQIPNVRPATGITIRNLPQAIESGQILNFQINSPTNATVVSQ